MILMTTGKVKFYNVDSQQIWKLQAEAYSMDMIQANNEP